MERNLSLIALFAALIAALGLIPSFTLPFGIPISAQSLGVMLCGTVLGAKRGAAAVLLFLFLVAVGLPLLSGGRGGIGVFVGPTAGFLYGFPVAAFIAGLVMTRLTIAPLWAAIIGAFLGGIVVLYAFGTVGFALVLDKSLRESLNVMAVFIPGDLVKVVLTGIITQMVARVRPSALLSRA